MGRTKQPSVEALKGTDRVNVVFRVTAILIKKFSLATEAPFVIRALTEIARMIMPSPVPAVGRRETCLLNGGRNFKKHWS